MIFTFLITIAFIGELVIAGFLILTLMGIDKQLVSADAFITEAKPDIKVIFNLGNKISEQLIEFAEDFKEKIEKKEEDTALQILQKALIALLLLKFNNRTIRKFKRSRLGRAFKKGFKLVQNML